MPCLGRRGVLRDPGRPDVVLLPGHLSDLQPGDQHHHGDHDGDRGDRGGEHQQGRGQQVRGGIREMEMEINLTKYIDCLGEKTMNVKIKMEWFYF